MIKASPPARWIKTCVKSHTETYTTMVPDMIGKYTDPWMPAMGGMRMVRRNKTVCDEYETSENPRYKKWKREHDANNN